MAEPIIEVKIDEAKLRNVQRLLQDISRALPRVISRTINRTVTPVRTSMARQLLGPINEEAAAIRAAQKEAGRAALNLRFKISTIKRNIRFQKATYRVWQALIWIKRFKGQEAEASTETAFITEMPKSGHISIFRRLGAVRLPITDQIRRLMVQFFTGISGQVRQEAQARLERNVEDQVKLALNQWRAGVGSAV
ncbi:MAG: hypothetical protein ABSG99_02700 [Sedimentisphaerales bacterium]